MKKTQKVFSPVLVLYSTFCVASVKKKNLMEAFVLNRKVQKYWQIYTAVRR